MQDNVRFERGAEVRNAYLLRCMLSNGEQVTSPVIESADNVSANTC